MQGVRDWLSRSFFARLLPDKAAWTKHGTAVLWVYAEQGAFAELNELFTGVLTGAPGPAPGVARVLFNAFSKVLADRTKSALAASHTKEALACAAALACLGIPSAGKAKIGTLRRSRRAKGEAVTLLALAESHARPPKDIPTLEDFVATVHVLFGRHRARSPGNPGHTHGGAALGDEAIGDVDEGGSP